MGKVWRKCAVVNCKEKGVRDYAIPKRGERAGATVRSWFCSDDHARRSGWVMRDKGRPPLLTPRKRRTRCIFPNCGNMVEYGAGKCVPRGRKRAKFLKPIGVRVRDVPTTAFVCQKHIGADGMLVSDGVSRTKPVVRPGGSLGERAIRRLVRTGTLSDVNVSDATARREEEERVREEHKRALEVAGAEARAAQNEGTKLRYNNFAGMDDKRAVKLLHQQTGFPGFGMFNPITGIPLWISTTSSSTP